MNLFGKLHKLLFNSGYEEPVYHKYREQLILQNSRLVKTTSFIGAIIMFLLSGISLFLPAVSKVLPLYFTIACLFAIIWLVAKYGGKRYMISIACNYAFLAVAFFFSVGLDVIQKNATATTVCVLLVSLPLLIVDKPIREGICFLLMAVAFCIESVYIKQSPKASIDVLNAFSFLIVGSFLGYKHNNMVLRNIVGQDLLVKQRDTDALTSLYNKGAIEKKVVDFLEKQGQAASLVVTDMDNFKYINDTYGHHVGDEILQAFGDVLTQVYGDDGWISRFGGDEFNVFLPDISDVAVLEEKANQVLERIKDIRIKENEEYRAQICMGISIYPRDGATYEELFRNADTAMYHVKKNGKNGFKIFDALEKKKILLVDDVAVNRGILKVTLMDEFDILEAENGHQALDVLNYQEIDMVITDIQMPKMDGMELIRRIRDNARWDSIAIIANTQYGDLKLDDDVLSLGVDDFVYKPASPRVIQKRVRNVLKSKEYIG